MTSNRSWWQVFPLFAAVSPSLLGGCSDNAAERATAQVQRIADDLDSRTTATGAYVRIKNDELKETDPWGVRLKVTYSQGGIAEMIDVRSAGPDREFHTNDDVVAERLAANMQGIGAGIKKNAEETASNVARGVVKGAVLGVRESLQESIGRRTEENRQLDKAPSPVVPIEDD